MFSIQNQVLNCGIFDSVSESAKERIAQHCQPFTIGAGVRVFETSDTCQMMPIVTSGDIRVFSESDNGREITLYRVNQQQLCILTISCLLSGDRYPANAITESEVSGVSIPKALFMELFAEQTSFREQVLQTFSYRITELMQLLDAVTFKKLDLRLAQFLITHGPDIALSHQAIADELGSVREMVSRLLKQFEEKGWLQLSRKLIRVIDVNQLKLLLDSQL